jgi:iron complex outermembrane recepter protein
VQLDLFTFPHDYPGRVQRAPLSAEDVALGYTGGAITRLDLTRINLAQRSMETFSYEINYRLPIPSAYGTVNWTTTATHINSLLTRARPTSAPINHAGTRGALKWKGNSGLYWSSDRWSAGVTGYYINSYYDATTAPTPAIPTATGLDGRKIKHSLLFDLRGGYRFPAGTLGDHGWKTWLNGITINVGVQNVFDRMSALVTDGSGFYSRFTSPMQRFVYLEVKKTL